MQFNSKIIFSLIILFLFASTVISDAGSAENIYEQGFRLSIEGKTKNAIQAYLKAIEVKPDYAEAHHALGVLYFKIGNGTNAIDHFKKSEFLYKNRDDKQATFNLTIIRANLDKAYEKLGLDSDDFKLDTFLPTKGEWEPSGVGFMFGNQGYLFTTSSSIKGKNKIRIKFPNGETASAELVREFVVYKIAVLKLTSQVSNLAYRIVFENNPDFKKNNPIYAVNFSTLSITKHSLSKGKILKENALENNDKIIQISIDIEKKADGGPLFNQNGKLIGLILSKPLIQKSFAYLKDYPEKVGFAIKSSYLELLLSGLKGYKKKLDSLTAEANINPGINVNKVSSETINNFIFVETSN